MQRIQLQPAYLIHRRDYRETSALIDVLTREHGLKALIAKGVRRPKSKLKGLLQANRPLLVSWAGKGELGNLIEAESAGPTWQLTGSSLYCGMYANELIGRLLQRDDPNPDAFDAYQEILAGLAHSNDHAAEQEPMLRVFELKLLASMGYGLVLNRLSDADDALRPEQDYGYDPDSGPCLHCSDAPVRVSGNCLIALDRALGANGSEASAYLSAAPPACLAQAKRLLRVCLSVHLGSKPLASRKLFS